MGAARKPRWKPGAVVEIPFGDGWMTYGWLRKAPLMSVLDVRTRDAVPAEDAVRQPILFSVWVMAFSLRLWRIVGTVELPAELVASPSFVKRDVISGRATTYTDGHERPATAEELRRLEVAAVWDPEHVIDRVHDHYLGAPNKWVQSLRNRVLTGDRTLEAEK